MSPASKSIPPLSRLDSHASGLREVMFAGRGLHLLVGPLSSGKTTLMAALLDDALRSHDYLVTMFSRTQCFQFSDDSGFLIRSELNRFHQGSEGLLQGALDKGSDVIAVDEILNARMLTDAASVATRACKVVATIEAGSSAELIERLQELAHETGGEKLLERLGACLESVVFVDLGRDADDEERLRQVTIEADDRLRIRRGDLACLGGTIRI